MTLPIKWLSSKSAGGISIFYGCGYFDGAHIYLDHFKERKKIMEQYFKISCDRCGGSVDFECDEMCSFLCENCFEKINRDKTNQEMYDSLKDYLTKWEQDIDRLGAERIAAAIDNIWKD